MQSNSIRFDLSDRLIHFFRSVDLEGTSAPLQPENFGLNSFVEGSKWPALFLLRCAVRSHRLWATWSVRNGVRTIYGPRPAVCFSEMPLAAFLESSVAREAAGQAMSSYALTFPKTAMYKLGANPVIYGLSDRYASIPPGDGGGQRDMSASLLPPTEQYRYVTYNPAGPRRVDWLHEREWRWPFDGDLRNYENEFEEYGVISEASDIPGFDFSNNSLRGMGIIVKTENDAKKLAYDVLTLIDQGEVGRRHFSHILVRDLLPDTLRLYQPAQVDAAINAALLDFEGYFNLPENDVQDALKDFSDRATEVEAAESVVEPGEQGGCWLWLHDNTHPYVRKLIQANRVTVNTHGHYLAALPEFNRKRGRQQRENLAAQLAARLKAAYNIDSGYFSVYNSWNANDIPNYIDGTPDNDLYINRDH